MISDPGDWSVALLEQHLGELAPLWARRAEAWTTPGLTLHGLRALDERLDAHVDALALGGGDAEPLLRAALESEEAFEVLAAALPLLRAGLVDAVAEAFAGSPHVSALATALCFALQEDRSGLTLPPHARAKLEKAATQPPGWWLWTRAAAGEAVNTQEVRRMLGQPSVELRTLAWRIAAMLPAGTDLRAELTAALGDAPEVRAAALEAAAWTRQRDLLTTVRQLVSTSGGRRVEVLRLLAILGGAAELPLIQPALQDEALGPRRFELAGQLGHPALVEVLFPAMAGPDAEAAVQAGRTFERMTGLRLPTNGTVEIGDPEFPDEVPLPDAQAAARAWHTLKPTLGGTTRIERGTPLTGALPAELAERLDLPAYAEARLRDAFRGVESATAAQLQQFPWPGP